MYWDIETTDLDPNMAYLLTICVEIRNIKTGKIKSYHRVIKKSEIDKSFAKREVKFDYYLLKWFLELIKKEQPNLMIGHFNTYFDNPFVRTRAFKLGLNKLLPDYKTIRNGDTWFMSRSTLKMKRYSLQSVNQTLMFRDQKTHLDHKVWQLARFGDRKSLKYILDHNIKDVVMTRNVHKKLEKLKPIPSSYF